MSQRLLDTLIAAAPNRVPGQALQEVAAELRANAAWLYGLTEKDPGTLSLQEQAGKQATQADVQQAGLALAEKAFTKRELSGKTTKPGSNMVATPLTHQNNTLGVAVFLWDTQTPRLPDALASSLGFILAYSRLEEQAQQEAALRHQLEARLERACADECEQGAELTLLNSVSDAIIAGASPAVLLEKLCRDLVSVFGATQSGAALLDESGQTLHLVAEFVPPDRVPSVGMDIPVSNNPSSLYVIRMKAPLAVHDVQHDIRMAPIYEIMKQRGVASILILPLLVADRVIGTIGIDSAETREFREAEIRLALKAATLAAWAVNAQNKE